MVKDWLFEVQGRKYVLRRKYENEQETREELNRKYPGNLWPQGSLSSRPATFLDPAEAQGAKFFA